MVDNFDIGEQLYLRDIKQLETPRDILQAIGKLGKSWRRQVMIKLESKRGERGKSIWLWPGQLLDDEDRRPERRLGIYRKIFDRIYHDKLRISLVRRVAWDQNNYGDEFDEFARLRGYEYSNEAGIYTAIDLKPIETIDDNELDLLAASVKQEDSGLISLGELARQLMVKGIDPYALIGQIDQTMLDTLAEKSIFPPIQPGIYALKGEPIEYDNGSTDVEITRMDSPDSNRIGRFTFPDFPAFKKSDLGWKI